MEQAPYHSPEVSVPVRPAKEEAAPETAAEMEEGSREEGGVKPFIPAPPPLPPILAPVPEEEVVPEVEPVPEEEEGKVLLRRPRVPVRSQTVNYSTLSPQRANDFR